MKEEWRFCHESANYEVSNLGNIRRGTPGGKNTASTYVGRPLKGYVDNQYRRVKIGSNGVFQKFSVHRLVATAFIGEIPKGMQINHKNGIKSDNRASNLEIVTCGENNRHAFNVLGRLSGREKLSDTEVREIRRRYAQGETQTEIAKHFPVTVQTVHNIVHGYSQTRPNRQAEK